ncbi:hypothetical protein HPB50_016099 [Hyalomma asiaticum]|uniref:Uncharacterized protein n=1 Tax=Hyalomma asiaticum TaxID=266040 RepID=A0ACB7SRC5_HYAAI|nr:hypothetical protein HPB50_016099 [Hyalomma asiaticum]
MEKKKTNFAEEERAVLLELVARHRSVVENMKTDAVSVSRKRDTWKKIEEEYKCRHNVTPRTSAQLKKCWENLKDKWRRCNAEDMRERFSTGCEDIVDEPPEYWSWDGVDGTGGGTEATGAHSHDNEPATADGRPGAPEAPEAPGAPEASGDLAPTSSDVPAGKIRPASSTRQAAVSLELAARISAIKEDREEKKTGTFIKTEVHAHGAPTKYATYSAEEGKPES